ncbi:hypothetical protein Bbelb_291910 [Branchiostoma belcheri]|nr:hypothetical protein Bbelb_291910 [Branchiostoma belcheri]
MPTPPLLIPEDRFLPLVTDCFSMCHYSSTIIYPIKLEYLSTLHTSGNRPGQMIRACYDMPITTEEARAATHEEMTSPSLDLTYVKIIGFGDLEPTLFFHCGQYISWHCNVSNRNSLHIGSKASKCQNASSETAPDNWQVMSLITIEGHGRAAQASSGTVQVRV